jgi:Porphyromonas-type peptidyl-arginine deiminase
MKNITVKAIENFKKALSEGKTLKKNNLKLRNSTVLEYTDLPANIRIPGQFEENQAIAMTWQYGFNADFSFNDVPASDTTPGTLGKVACDLAAAIQQNAKVIIRVKAAQDSTTVKNIMIARGTPLTNYSFYVHPIDSFWDRDSASISFYYGEQDNIGMIDMDYYTLAALEDGMGNVITDFETINEGGRVNDDLIPVALGTKLGYPVYHTPLNDEGGNIISDGLGAFWGSDGTRRNNTEAINGAFLG